MNEELDPLKQDFRKFLYIIWKHLGLPTPTKRQYEIARYLQHGPRRKIVMGFRGVGKSWITVAYVLWRLYCNPQLNVLVVSASKAKATDFTTFAKRLVSEVELLAHLRPGPGQRDSALSFDVGPAGANKDPSVASIGITGQLTGGRADVIIPDDVEVPSNSATPDQRAKLAERVKEFDALLKPGGEITYLGTPQTESSIYNTLAKRGYEIRIWPVRYPTPLQVENYGEKLAPEILSDLKKNPQMSGKTTEGERFSELDLREREASYGQAGFALQFMLDTRLSDVDRYPLKLSDLIVMALPVDCGPERAIWASAPEYELKDLLCVGLDGDRYYRPVPMTTTNYLPFQGIVMAIDPSGRGKDETAYAVVACLHGLLFLLDAGGFANGYGPTTLNSLAEIAKKFKVNKILAEANYGDGMFTALLKPVLQKVYPCGVEEVKHSIQKEKRIIDTLEPVMSSHRLIVDQKLISKDYASTKHLPTDNDLFLRYQLFYQMTRITRDRGALSHDDRLDALSIAVNYWTQHMAQDVDQAVKQSQDRALDKELERFKDHVFGRMPEPERFFDA